MLFQYSVSQFDIILVPQRPLMIKAVLSYPNAHVGLHSSAIHSHHGCRYETYFITSKAFARLLGDRYKDVPEVVSDSLPPTAYNFIHEMLSLKIKQEVGSDR